MKYKAFKTAFTLRGRIKPNNVFFLFLFLILSISAGCGSIDSITGATSSVSSGGLTLSVVTDKSKVALDDTLIMTIRANCSSACFTEGDYKLALSSNSKFDTVSAEADFTIAAGDALSGLFTTFSATAVERGTATITASFIGFGTTISTSISVEIE